MKKVTSALLALSFVAAGAAGAGAQTSTTPTTPGTRTDRPATERGATERKSDRASKPERQAWSNPQLHEANDIVGTAVQGADGKRIGKVEALLIEPRDGKVSHAVIGMGGVLGVGENKVVVPYSALKMSGHDGGRKATIEVDQATLDSAPKYVKAGDRDRGAASPATAPRVSPGSGSGSGSTSTDRSTTSDRPASEKK